jgi:hypothetical protein
MVGDGEHPRDGGGAGAMLIALALLAHLVCGPAGLIGVACLLGLMRH